MIGPAGNGVQLRDGPLVIPCDHKVAGTASGTNRGSFSSTEETSLTSAPPAVSAHWVAASGDTINSTFVVVSFQVNTPLPGYATITESHTVTGGTGSFCGSARELRPGTLARVNA